jgi:hypothetical protein
MYQSEVSHCNLPGQVVAQDLGERDLLPPVRGRPDIPIGNEVRRGRIPPLGQRLQFGNLGAGRGVIRRWRRAEVASGTDHPGLPAPGVRLDLLPSMRRRSRCKQRERAEKSDFALHGYLLHPGPAEANSVRGAPHRNKGPGF